MKKILMLAVWCWCILLPLGAGSTGRADLERQTTRLSAQLLLNDWQKNLANQNFSELEKALYHQMRQNLAHCVSISAAQELLQDYFKSAYRRYYQEQAARLLQPLMNNLSPEEQQRLLKPPPQYFKASCAQIYPVVFVKSRQRLAAEQRRQLFKEFYPSPSELEQLSDQELIAQMAKRFAAALPEPLLQENQALLKKSVIVPAIKLGRQQQKQQLQLAARLTVPAELWDADTVQQHLKIQLQKHLTRQAKSGQFQFGLFPQTQQKIAQIAAALPRTRTLAALPETLNVDFYRPLIQERPQEHRNLSDSLRRVLPELQPSCIQTAEQVAGVPEQYRKQLSQDREFVRAVNTYVRQKLTPQLKKIRHQVAQDWVKTHHPELSSGAWHPAPETVEKFAVSPQTLLPVNAAPWVESTILMQKLQRQALMREVAKLKHQMQVVKQVYDQVAAHCRNQEVPASQDWWQKLFDWGSSELKIADIVALYRQAVLEKLPKNAVLFPSVNQEIDLRSRAIWQLLQQEKKSGQSLKPHHISLVLTQEAELLKLYCGTWQCNAPVGKPEILHQTLTKQLQTHLKSYPKSQVIIIQLVIKSPRITYSTVANLRAQLQHILQNRGQVRDSYQDQ